MEVFGDVFGSDSPIGYEGVGEGTIIKALFEAAGKPIGPPLPPQRQIGEEGIEKLRAAFESMAP